VDGGLRERLGALTGQTLRTANGRTFWVAGVAGAYLVAVDRTGRRPRIGLASLERAAADASADRPVAGHIGGYPAAAPTRGGAHPGAGGPGSPPRATRMTAATTSPRSR
jgi:hypothetical protein